MRAKPECPRPCPDRYPGCQQHCDIGKAFKAKRAKEEEALKKYHADNDAEAYHAQVHKEISKRLNRGAYGYGRKAK